MFCTGGYDGVTAVTFITITFPFIEVIVPTILSSKSAPSEVSTEEVEARMPALAPDPVELFKE